MDFKDKIDILDKVSYILLDTYNDFSKINNFPDFDIIKNSNPWFTKEFIMHSLLEWSCLLSRESIENWIYNYFPDNKLPEQKLKIGIIMAGNIPLVGFHDFLCSWICNQHSIIKLSSKDNLLTKWLIETIIKLDPQTDCTFVEDKFPKHDAIIATGSNNTNRYFEYYFKNTPKILRSNRNSIAVLSGNETTEELELLADDIFMYFGLGCRNVSKLHIPHNYDFNNLCKSFAKYSHVFDHHKYANNVNYQYTIFAMNQTLHVNAGNILLTENQNINSPIGVIHYEYYQDIKALEEQIKLNLENIQCVVGNSNFESISSIKFGETQKPSVCDYADNIDTINFIQNILK